MEMKVMLIVAAAAMLVGCDIKSEPVERSEFKGSAYKVVSVAKPKLHPSYGLEIPNHSLEPDPYAKLKPGEYPILKEPKMGETEMSLEEFLNGQSQLGWVFQQRITENDGSFTFIFTSSKAVQSATQ